MQNQDIRRALISAPRVYQCAYREAPAREGRRLEHEAGLYLLQTGLRDLTSIDCDLDMLPSLIVKTAKEKPVLSAPDLPFNISHSHGLAVCAFSPEPVGVDVERARPVKETLMRRVLSASEYALCQSQQYESADLFFIRLWTLKEACGKQTGEGVAQAMQEASFVLPGPLPEIGEWICVPSSLPHLFFYQTRLPEDFVLSLCCGASYDPAKIEIHSVFS